VTRRRHLRNADNRISHEIGAWRQVAALGRAW
jgi:hypothetical protein